MCFLYENEYFTLYTSNEYAIVYAIHYSKEKLEISWPSFEIDNRLTGNPDLVSVNESVVKEKTKEICVEGVLADGVHLTMILRVCDASPIIRFHYSIKSNVPKCLTKKDGEKLCYLSYAAKECTQQTEVRLSNYDHLIHGYCLNEIPAFLYEDDIMGPILTEQRNDVCMLTAYEHGSMYPDKFIVFRKDDNVISLNALRGNYWNGQDIFTRQFDTIWLQLGAVVGNQDKMANYYRTFQLKYCTQNMESRKPYIFYNSWAFQERNKFYNKQAYLTSMNEERMLQEIEVASKLGVEVFVVDCGWFSKTGDWETNRERFPHGMKYIADILVAHNMKLGLWFAPTEAAVSSRVLKKHTLAKAYKQGNVPKAFPVWETEDSYAMCIVSDYWKAFADELIRLATETGVRYFKWDAVGMYDCEQRNHHHGGADSASEECRDCYAFYSGIYLSKIADKLCSVYPDAIVDVDMTEAERYFGLGFLSSGKFFTMNNGPYYPDYDICVPKEQWINIFVNPGAARTWICRQNLSYDKWIPSNLMMAHYLPDDPTSSQLINIASLILGQNGVWGDLPNVSDEGVLFFSRVIDIYKRVRDDITQASPVAFGRPGEMVEMHEKINPDNGRGVIVIFSNGKGKYKFHINSKKISNITVNFGDISLSKDNSCPYIEANFEKKGAAILFFE